MSNFVNIDQVSSVGHIASDILRRTSMGWIISSSAKYIQAASQGEYLIIAISLESSWLDLDHEVAWPSGLHFYSQICSWQLKVCWSYLNI